MAKISDAPTIGEFVAKMSREKHRQIIADYELFEKQGFIGECALRTAAEEYMELVNLDKGNYIIMFMESLIKEIFRYYSNEYWSILKY